jgi:hypothetical protein
MAAQIILQIGHEKGGRDAFAGNVTCYEPKPPLPQIQKILVIAA